jgi:thiamine biosynthesis lipoprotein
MAFVHLANAQDVRCYNEGMNLTPTNLCGLVLASSFTWSTTATHACPDTKQPERTAHRFAEVHMGTAFKLTLYATSQAEAAKAAKAAFARVAELDRILSHYRDDSELSKLCRTSGTWVAVSDELWLMLTESNRLSKRSSGGFDVTVGPLVQLWRRSRRHKELPSEELLSDSRKRVGYELIEFDPANKRVRLKQANMRIDLGGIAKGYAADEALRMLVEHGTSSALIDAGGDLVAGDAPPGKKAWTLAVAAFGAKTQQDVPLLSIANAAAATSGDRFQFVEIDGKRYSHIIDPRTGLGLTTPSSVTVIASGGMLADALASAVSVLGPEAGLKLIDATPNAAALIVRQESDAPKTYRSKQFDRWLKPKAD